LPDRLTGGIVIKLSFSLVTYTKNKLKKLLTTVLRFGMILKSPKRHNNMNI